MSDKPITREEMVEMFGSEMPVEAVQLMWNAPPEMTLGEIRARLRQMAAERAALAPGADGETLNFRFSKNDHGPLLSFVEAENADGYSVHVGEWSDDGQYRVLTIPNPYALRAEIVRLTAALKDIDKCRRYYLQAETPEQRDMRADEFQRFVAGTVSATLTKDTP